MSDVKRHPRTCTTVVNQQRMKYSPGRLDTERTSFLFGERECIGLCGDGRCRGSRPSRRQLTIGDCFISPVVATVSVACVGLCGGRGTRPAAIRATVRTAKGPERHRQDRNQTAKLHNTHGLRGSSGSAERQEWRMTWEARANDAGPISDSYQFSSRLRTRHIAPFPGQRSTRSQSDPLLCGRLLGVIGKIASFSLPLLPALSRLRSLQSPPLYILMYIDL
jgi:hypothetical protein